MPESGNYEVWLSSNQFVSCSSGVSKDYGARDVQRGFGGADRCSSQAAGQAQGGRKDGGEARRCRCDFALGIWPLPRLVSMIVHCARRTASVQAAMTGMALSRWWGVDGAACRWLTGPLKRE